MNISKIKIGNTTYDLKDPNAISISTVSTWAQAGNSDIIPSSKLPSYVDDVLEYESTSSFPETGESGKIYVATDTNKTYRWGGSSYVVISETLAVGTTEGTAYDGAAGAALKSKLDGIEAGAQTHRAPSAAEVKTALGTGSGTTKYLREDGTWATPPDTNTNTVTSINGKTGAIAAADIATVLTGAGYKLTDTDTNTHYTAVPVAGGKTATSNATSATTNPYINIIENSAKSGGIRIKGSGATSVSAVNGVITISSTDTNTQAVSSVVGQTGAVTAAQIGTALTNAGYKLTDTNTTYSAGTGLSLSSNTFSLATSGVTAGTYKSVTVDSYGRVTAGDNTDSNTKNTTGTTNNTGKKMFLVGAESQEANPVTYSNSNCYIGTDNCLYSGGTKVLTAHQDISGKQDTVAKLGSTTKPVYTSAAGTFAACSTYAGGTAVTLNGTSKAASTASFYAPTAAGASGQILLSSGGAPNWKTGDIIHYVTSPSGTAGSSTSGSYNRTRWTGTVDGVTALYTGLTVMFKIPIAGVKGGCSLNINSLGEHPIALNANTLLTAHYPVNAIIMLIYDADQEGSIYVNGTVTSYTGCWKIHNYDSNTTYSAMSEDEGKTGTATTARSITAAVLKEVIDDRGYIAASSLGAWAKAATKPSYTLDEVTDGSTRKLSDYLPAIQKSHLNSTSAKWSIFAKIPSSTTSRYNDCIALVQGLGYYYTGNMTGAWIVEMRTNNSAVPSMTATCLSPTVSTSAIEFGYYIDSEAGFIYYGVKTSSRRGAFSVVPLINTNYTLMNDADLTTAPTGWTAATHRIAASSYGELTYDVDAVASATGAVTLAATTPVHVLTVTGNVSSVALSGTLAEGHSCHAIFACGATSYTVIIGHDATNRVCPNALDLSLTIPANGYVEVDFLKANGKIYVRGV